MQAGLREASEEMGIRDLAVLTLRHGYPDGAYAVVEEVMPAFESDPEHLHVDFIYVCRTHHGPLAGRSVWVSAEEYHHLPMLEASAELLGDLFALVKPWLV